MDLNPLLYSGPAGTTVATNALLERKGERTALCVTKVTRSMFVNLEFKFSGLRGSSQGNLLKWRYSSTRMSDLAKVAYAQ